MHIKLKPDDVPSAIKTEAHDNRLTAGSEHDRSNSFQVLGTGAFVLCGGYITVFVGRSCRSGRLPFAAAFNWVKPAPR